MTLDKKSKLFNNTKARANSKYSENNILRHKKSNVQYLAIIITVPESYKNSNLT